MKLGLLADIHADFTALSIALAILQRERVDTILCAGDLVEKGGDADAVVALVRQRGILCVRGNHDEKVAANQRWLYDHLDPISTAARSYLLEPETVTYIEQLPFALRFHFEGTRVLLVHGSPASNIEYLNPNTPQPRLRELARTADADIVVAGHTHQPMDLRVRGMHFINPGSVCLRASDENQQEHGSYTCAVLSLPDYKFQVFDLKTGKLSTAYARDEYAYAAK